MIQTICIFLMGLPFIFYGIAMKKGWTNKWYLHTQIVPYMPPASNYISIPLGCAFLTLPLLALIPLDKILKGDMLVVIWGICIVLMLIFPIWKPNFLKPEWLLDLEARYSKTEIEQFRAKWKQIDRDEWSRKIVTQQGREELIEWAQKH